MARHNPCRRGPYRWHLVCPDTGKVIHRFRSTARARLYHRAYHRSDPPWRLRLVPAPKP